MTRLEALRTATRSGLLFVSVGAALAASGCGDDDPKPEVSLGKSSSTADGQEKRIADLQRRLREQKARDGRREESAPPGGSGSVLKDDANASFDGLAGTLGGQVGLNVGRVGAADSESLGSLRTGKAWSTIKLAIAARVLSDARGPGGLSAAQSGQLRQAITASDNAAAAQLFKGLEREHGGLGGASRAIAQPLRDAGDESTTISTQGRGGFSTYGQTDWALDAQQRFTARLAAACVPDAASARELLDLMGQVVPGQRWGLGAAGVPARFKGGWGPGESGGYLVRQTGVLDVDGGEHPVVVTLAALPSDGQFVTGQQMLTKMAKWVVQNVDARAAAPSAC